MNHRNRFHLSVVLVIIIWLIDLVCSGTSAWGTLKKSRFTGELVFDRARGGFHIFKINGSDPDKEIQLTRKDRSSAGDDIEPRWSPDGTQIAYINREPSGKSNIFIIDPEGGNRIQITNFSDGIIFNLRWDKSGKELQFNFNPNKPGQDISEKIVEIRTKMIRDVPKKKETIKECDSLIQSPNEELLICIKWLISGKEKLTIYQAETLKNSWVNQISALFKRLFQKERQSLLHNGIVYKKITEMTLENASDPLWSQDSIQFAIMIGDRLTTFDKNGREISRSGSACEDEGAACMRSWSYDSKKILYSCYCGAEGIQERIYLIDLETNKSVYITEGQNPDWYFNRR